MKHRLLAVWRSLPEPLRRVAHLAVQAPSIALSEMIQAWSQLIDDHNRRTAFTRAKRRARSFDRALSDPITIVGYLGAVHGLGEGARSLARGFLDAGRPLRALDLSETVGLPVQLPVTTPAPASTERGTVVSHINPPELLRWAIATEGRFLAGRRHIGYWAWELEEAPADWAPAFDLVDEVWAPSEFAADAIRKLAPKHVRVSAAPYPVFLNGRADPDRARFALPEDKVIVFMAFDLRSTAQRKNPRAALDAFREANRRCDHAALLICKVVGADLYPETFANLAKEVAEDPGVRLMIENLSSADMAVLTASVDVILSLHRSEGYGLLLAEGIWQGKPAVATGWSSNVEFMDSQASALVDYHLVPVEGDGAIYRSGRWAEADITDAADKLAALIQDDMLRAAWSEAATRNQHVSFNRARWLAMLDTLLPKAG